MLAAEEVLHTAGLKRFYEYWDSLPKTAHMPDRQDFNPAAIHTLMPNVTMLEIVSPEFVRTRLIGTAVAATIGIDMTDHNYLDYIADDERGHYIELLDLQFSVPCGRRSIIRARRSSGALGRIEVIALPMFYAHNGSRMLLSYFEALDATSFDEVEVRQVQAFEGLRWIDIGAGVPPEH